MLVYYGMIALALIIVAVNLVEGVGKLRKSGEKADPVPFLLAAAGVVFALFVFTAMPKD